MYILNCLLHLKFELKRLDFTHNVPTTIKGERVKDSASFFLLLVVRGNLN